MKQQYYQAQNINTYSTSNLMNQSSTEPEVPQFRKHAPQINIRSMNENSGFRQFRVNGSQITRRLDSEAKAEGDSQDQFECQLVLNEQQLYQSNKKGSSKEEDSSEKFSKGSHMPRFYLQNEKNEEEEQNLGYTQEEQYNEDNIPQGSLQFIQNLELEIEDLNHRLEKTSVEKDQLLILVEQFEKENLHLQDEKFMLKEDQRSREQKIFDLRKKNNRLYKIVVGLRKNGSLDSVDDIEDLGISDVELDNSEDSMEQRQQSNQNYQAGRLSTKIEKKQGQEEAQSHKNSANDQLDQIQKVLAQLSSNIFEGDQAQSKQQMHNQEITQLKKNIEALTLANNQMSIDLGIHRQSYQKWQTDCHIIQQKNKIYKEERKALRDIKNGQEIRIQTLTAEIQKLQIENQMLSAKQQEPQDSLNLKKFYLGGDFVNLNGSNIKEQNLIKRQTGNNNQEQITSNCQPQFVTAGEESCDHGRDLSPIEIKSEAYQGHELELNSPMKKQNSPNKMKQLKIEVSKFQEKSVKNNDAISSNEQNKQSEDLLRQILNQLQMMNQAQPETQKNIGMRTPQAMSVPLNPFQHQTQIYKSPSKKVNKTQSSSSSNGAQEITQGLTVFPQLGHPKQHHQQPSFNNISEIGQPGSEQFAEMLNKINKMLTHNQTQMSMDLTNAGFNLASNSRQPDLQAPLHANMDNEQSMIEEFKEVLHPMQALYKSKNPPVFPSQILHQSRIIDHNKSKESLKDPQITPAFRAEDLLAPQILMRSNKSKDQADLHNSEFQSLPSKQNNKSTSSLQNQSSQKLNKSQSQMMNNKPQFQKQAENKQSPTAPQIIPTSAVQYTPQAQAKQGNLMISSSMIGNFLLNRKTQPGGIFSSHLVSPINQMVSMNMIIQSSKEKILTKPLKQQHPALSYRVPPQQICVLNQQALNQVPQ